MSSSRLTMNSSRPQASFSFFSVRTLPPAPSPRWVKLADGPNEERRRAFEKMIGEAVRFLSQHEQHQFIPLKQRQFDDLWYLLAIVRQPGMLWGGADRCSESAWRKIKCVGNSVAQFLNPEWGFDSLKHFLESRDFKDAIQEHQQVLCSLGRYEDWCARLANHKASGRAVKIGS